MNLFKFLKPGETRKFISTCITFFLITVSYSIARRIKDTVIVTKMGAEIITFIKMLIILPISIIVIIIYNWLSSRIDKVKLFYIVNSIMISYFAIYGLVEFFKPSIFTYFSIDIDLQKFISIKGLDIFLYQISMLLKNLPHILYYVTTEMYGSLVLSFMFWRYVNEFTKLEDTYRLYPSYMVAGSLSTAFAGLFGKIIKFTLDKFIGKTNIYYSNYSTFISMCLITMFTICSLISYKISVSEMVKEQSLNDLNIDQEEKPKKKKVKLSFIDSIKTLFTNKIILLMTICVVSYMSSINIVEVSWKKAVKKFYGDDRAGIDSLLSESQLIVGLLTVTLSIICHNVIKKIGWTAACLVNPIVVGITGVSFLLLSVVGDVSLLNYFFATNTMILALRLGQFQNIASKACKYSFFDTTKEMALVTLDKDMRDRGKAAIDVLGGRFGKSLGSMIQQLLVICIVIPSQYHNAQEIIAPYLFFVLVFLVSCWILATIMLGQEIKKQNKEINK